MKKWPGSCFSTEGGDSISRGGWFANFSQIQNPIIEIYPGALQPRDFPCLPSCFIVICNKIGYK